MMDDAEQALVDRLVAGDESAFERLVGSYHDRLLRLARVYVRTDARAADVVQETWLAVLRGLPKFERRSSLKTWIFHILANRARTLAVREGRMVLFADLESPDAPDAESPADHWFDTHGRWKQAPGVWSSRDPEGLALNTEIREALQVAIDQLPEGQRAVVVLRDVEGLDAAEACNILGISGTNQRVLLHRGRTRLRRALAELLGRPAR